MLFSGLTLTGLQSINALPKARPLPSYSIPYKAKAVPVAAQFNEIVSEGPKSAWGSHCARRPSGYNFLHYPNQRRLGRPSRSRQT